MHKFICTFSICLSLLLVDFFSPKTANAFFFKSDIEQAVSKITSWVQTMKEKCQEIIEGVQSSQFGQFVGKGMENAKKGITFASYGDFQKLKGEVLSSASEKYGDFQKVLSSDEAKSVELPTQIALKTKEINTLKEEKLTKQEEVNAEIDLLKEQTNAKIKLVQTNLSNIETKSSETSNEDKLAIEIENINNNYATEEGLLKDEYNAIEDEYTEKIDALVEEINELSERLAELGKGFFDKQKEKKEKKSTEEALNKTYEEYTTQSSSVSIKDEEKIRKKRQKGIKEKNTSIIVETANKRGEIFDAKDRIDKKERLSSTQPGEADRSVVISQVLGEQINALRKLVEISIADLETQTTMEIGLWQEVTIPKMPEKFSLCDYADKDRVGYKSTFDLDKIKQMKNQVEEKIDQGKNLIDQGKELIEQGKEFADEFEETATSIMNDVQTGLDNQSTTSLRSMF